MVEEVGGVTYDRVHVAHCIEDELLARLKQSLLVHIRIRGLQRGHRCPAADQLGEFGPTRQSLVSDDADVRRRDATMTMKAHLS
jgi:hypothetical protein